MNRFGGRVLVTLMMCASCNDAALPPPPLPRPALSLSPLEPCRRIEELPREFRQYEERVEAALIDTSLQDSESYARFLVLPSFEPEWVVGIYGFESDAIVEYRVARDQIWRANHKRIFQDGSERTVWREQPAEVFVDWETETLDVQTWRRLQDVLTPSLLWAEEAAGPGVYGDDGTTFRFMFRSPEVGELCGEAWSPETETVPGQLVLIAEQLKELATAESRSGKAKKLSAIDHCLRKLEPW